VDLALGGVVEDVELDGTAEELAHRQYRKPISAAEVAIPINAFSC
jgi:hypothetical protein